jgi:hypothetical protein
MRHPPPGAAVACHSSSKPSSGVGRDAPASLARRVAGQRLGIGDLDQVADRAEAGLACRLEVTAAVGGRGVGGVDDEALALGEAQAQEGFLARARAQQVHRDAHVRLEEAVAIERRLAGALDAAQDHRLHRVSRRAARRAPAGWAPRRR